MYLTISLAIYDDRIEIASPGMFPPQITAENIKEPHESYPHNLKVAEALYRMTYLENWGNGARRIMDACKAQGVEPPTWCSDGGFVTITFKRPDFTSSTIKTGKEDKKVTKEDKYPLSTPQVELLIQKMSDSFMSMKDMANVCDIKDLKYFRESYITPALEEELIERLYPNQPKHPKQQYRLTEIAKRWLTNNTK